MENKLINNQNAGIDDVVNTDLGGIKSITIESKLDKMDPEVAKKLLEQVPCMTDAAKSIYSDHTRVLENSINKDTEETMSYFDSCDTIINTCQKKAEREDISFEESKWYIDKMETVAEKKSKKNTENKNFKRAMLSMGAILGGAVLLLGAYSIANSVKIDKINK